MEQKDPSDKIETLSIGEISNILTQESATADKYREQMSDLKDRFEETIGEGSGFEQCLIKDSATVYIVGDVHARAANVADFLSKLDAKFKEENSSLGEKLNQRDVVIAFLGDYVHSEKNFGNYQYLSDSASRKKMAMENLNTVLGVLNLKCSFPKSVFAVKGNHDVGAVKANEVGKFGIDQGDALCQVLKPKGLDQDTQELLNRLPLFIALANENKNILLSHAFLSPMSYKDLVIQLNKTKNTPGSLSYLQSIDEIFGGRTREKIMEAIKANNPKVVKAFTWAKVSNAINSPSAVLPVGESLNLGFVSKEDSQNSETMRRNVRAREEALKIEAREFLSSFSYQVIKTLFSKTKGGSLKKPEDFVWFVGHEAQQPFGYSELSKIVGGKYKDKHLDIFQINNQSGGLPVTGFKIDSYRSEDVVKNIKHFDHSN